MIEERLNGYGYMNLQMGKVEKAKLFFQMNIDYYPKRANAYDGMAEDYQSQEDYPNALKYVTQAFELSGDDYHKDRMKEFQQKNKQLSYMLKTTVSVDWLNNNLDNPNLIILDASQHNSQAKLNTKFENIQIKGARLLAIKDAFSDKDSKYPNTLLSPKDFEVAAQNLGINKSSKMVVYDNRGVYFSPRVWWMFKTMGHQEIAVLDGGLPEWINQGYPTEQPQNHVFKLGNFTSNFRPEKVKNFHFIKENINTKEALVIDARSEDRFKALAPEPRVGLRGGNIPTSINLPYSKLLENGQFRSKNELTDIFSNMKLGDKKLVFSCGSGITACILLLATELSIGNKTSIYDGSWTEWAQREKA